jgi:cystathionine beta-lyase
MYDFDTLLDRRGTDCFKWDGLSKEYGDPDLMPFWVADMDFKCLPDLDEALRARTLGATYGYTFAGEGYFRSITGWYGRRHGMAVSAGEIVPVPGVLTGIHMALAALAKPGDPIIINSPVYPPFYSFGEDGRHRVLQSPLIEENGRYFLDFADLDEKMRQGARFYVLCSPHNPSGRIWSREELSEIVALCQRHGVMLLSDEIHGDLAMPGKTHHPLSSLSEEARKISIVVSAPSKTFNCAGLKSSFLIISDEAMRQKVRRKIESYHIDIDLFGLLATKVVFEKGDIWLDELMLYLQANAKRMLEFIDARMPGVKASMPDASYLLWMDCRGANINQEELMRRIKVEGRLALNDGASFGPGGTGYLRFNYGTPRSYLEKGLAGLERALGAAPARELRAVTRA